MQVLIAALGAGTLFGLGLAIAQMVNPAKVLAFLDVAGAWDATLAVVLGAALAVTLISFRVVLRRPKPVLAKAYAMPARGAIDGRLIAGAVLFGIGWGMIGLCPGPAVAALAYGMGEAVTFVVAMIGGMAVARLVAA